MMATKTTKKKATSTKAGAAKAAPKKTKNAAEAQVNEIIYAALGFASLDPDDFEKAYNYLVKKGSTRGKKLEKRTDDVSKKAREMAEELKEQFDSNFKELTERFNSVVDDILERVGGEGKEKA
jgi:hypothetical protein